MRSVPKFDDDLSFKPVRDEVVVRRRRRHAVIFSLTPHMDGYYDEASRTLRWKGGNDQKELLRLLSAHADAISELHVA